MGQMGRVQLVAGLLLQSDSESDCTVSSIMKHQYFGDINDYCKYRNPACAYSKRIKNNGLLDADSERYTS